MSGGNDDPGPWMEKILPTFTVSSQKKTCALCELWFSVENLTGLCSWKGVLAKKSEFGDKKAERKLKDPRTNASRLYSGVQLCSFCAQLVTPEDLDLASPSPGKKKTFSIMIAPASRNENCKPIMVRTGIIALRKAWRHITCLRVSPFARAVRT